MKDLKDIILDRRIRNLEIEGKQVSDKYISVFNSYLEQIAESLSDYENQVRKEVILKIRRLSAIDVVNKQYIIETEILDQIQGE